MQAADDLFAVPLVIRQEHHLPIRKAPLSCL